MARRDPAMVPIIVGSLAGILSIHMPCTRAQDALWNDGPLVLWKPGTWWLTETHVLRDTSDHDSGPEEMGDFSHYHRWQVAGKVELGGGAVLGS